MELFSLTFISLIGFLLLLGNLLLWFKVRKLEASKALPNFSRIIESPELLISTIEKLDKDIQDLYEINSKLSRIAKRGVCKVGITKFNALGEKNGNQSFALALLDYKNNGVVISCLQTASCGRLYVKNIREGITADDAKLLSEEKKALERAKQVIF